MVKQREQLYWASIFKETKLSIELTKLNLKIHKCTKYLINLNKNTVPSKVKTNKNTQKLILIRKLEEICNDFNVVTTLVVDRIVHVSHSTNSQCWLADKIILFRIYNIKMLFKKPWKQYYYSLLFKHIWKCTSLKYTDQEIYTSGNYRLCVADMGQLYWNCPIYKKTYHF